MDFNSNKKSGRNGLNFIAHGGANQSGMRAYNEKLVLTLIRKNCQLLKTEISALTGLSTQSASVIVRRLEEDGLLIKGAPTKGKVGQPSTPMLLNPEGAYFFGVQIGRRATEIVLVNFVGKVLKNATLAYKFPLVQSVRKFIFDEIEGMIADMSPTMRERIAGMGVSMPSEIWNWANIIDIDPILMNEWREVDVVAEFSQLFDFPVYLGNDASSACAAELIFGTQARSPNFLYIYVGYFVGGGMVLQNRLFTGSLGNSGAIGSMMIQNQQGEMVQLIEVSSLYLMEHELEKHEDKAEQVWSLDLRWEFMEATIDHWVEVSSKGLAQAIVNATSVIDFEAVIIDGWLPKDVRKKLVARTRNEYLKLCQLGLKEPAIAEGSLGGNARPIGAATLPLSKKFMIE